MKYELLAPAGNLEVAITAFEAGADAVYAGFGKFNAREMNENFSYSDMAKLSYYAKKNNKKFYLTFNTLVKEQELLEFSNLIKKATILEPDAFIVQDIGVLKLVREIFPNIEIHSSTQMGIHNSAGVKFAKDLGVKRVILERQIEMKDLEIIMSKSDLPIEVFVHGALCSSLSGACLFSSWLGGYSGNRGKCKQPCRRRYYSVGKNSGGNGFFYSTQDLYSLDLIPKLKDLGVASFKIEGRLKRADYVKQAVKAYRLMLDSTKENEQESLKKAKAILAGTYGRKWSHGFYEKDSSNNLISHKSPGASGLAVGKVVDVKDSGVFVHLNRNIYKGDRVRVQSSSGDEQTGFTITLMKKNNRECVKAFKGDTVFIKTSRGGEKGATLYKTGMSTSISTKTLNSLKEFKPLPKLNYKISLGDYGLKILVSSNRENYQYSYKFSPELAKTSPVDNEGLKKIFANTEKEGFAISKIETEIDGSYFVPVSILKKARREFASFLDNTEFNIKSSEEKSNENEMAKALRKISEKYSKNKIEDNDACQSFPRLPKTIKVDSLYEIKKDTEEVVLPFYCRETNLRKLKIDIDNAYNRGIRRFRVTGFFQFEILKKYKDVILSTSYPLPVTNSFAAMQLSDLGVKKVQTWLELEKTAIEECVKTFPLPVEIYYYGRPALLTTTAKISASEKIADSRGNGFLTKFDKNMGVHQLFPEKVMKIDEVEGASKFFDFSISKPNEEDFSTFNFYYNLN